MDWKKKFNKEFGIAAFTWNGSHETGLELANKSRKRVKDFISTEIIEKLIADIPDTFTTYDENANETRHKAFQSQLRDKWFNINQ